MPSGGTFDVASLSEQLKDLEKKLLVENLWETPAKYQQLLKEKSGIGNSIQPFAAVEAKFENIKI
ncbi:MAG: hypothetical protein AAB089_07635, partial [Nitrospirota bacterium]